jgi:hypothetical protein
VSVSVILKRELVKNVSTFIFSYLCEMLVLTVNATEEKEPVLIVQYRRVNGNHPETLVCEPQDLLSLSSCCKRSPVQIVQMPSSLHIDK